MLEHKEPVGGVEFTPDGKKLATGTNKGLRLWDLASCRLIKASANDFQTAGQIAFSRDGRIIAAVHQNPVLREALEPSRAKTGWGSDATPRVGQRC